MVIFISLVNMLKTMIHDEYIRILLTGVIGVLGLIDTSFRTLLKIDVTGIDRLLMGEFLSVAEHESLCIVLSD